MNKTQTMLEMSGVNTRELKAFVTMKCRRYAEKHGWDAAYRAAAVEFCLEGAARTVAARKLAHETIGNPRRFARRAAILSLKMDRYGNLVIPYWKKSWRTGTGTFTIYADTREAL